MVVSWVGGEVMGGWGYKHGFVWRLDVASLRLRASNYVKKLVNSM